jgi:hypothetical protein
VTILSSLPSSGYDPSPANQLTLLTCDEVDDGDDVLQRELVFMVIRREVLRGGDQNFTPSLMPLFLSRKIHPAEERAGQFSPVATLSPP